MALNSANVSYTYVSMAIPQTIFLQRQIDSQLPYLIPANISVYRVSWHDILAMYLAVFPSQYCTMQILIDNPCGCVSQ